MIWQILIAVLISSLILVSEHYWPWQPIIRRPLPKLTAYIMGVLAIHLPLTVLLLVWSYWQAVYALWAITLVSGGVVAGINHLDSYLETRTRMEISEHEARSLRPDHGAAEQ